MNIVMKFHLVSLVALALSLAARAQTQHPPTSPPTPKPAENPQLYRNSTFGFRYRIPYGWVDRTKKMQEGSNTANGEVLLAVFERPPEAAGDTINAAVVIAAEKAAAYPGLKKAEDYLAPLSELTTAKGFKAEGDPSELEIDSQRMVRADFSKALNDKLTMHQATLVLLSKGQIVSFTFIAESGDAVDELIEGISFSSLKSKAK
jgi:hypothetical protein